MTHSIWASHSLTQLRDCRPCRLLLPMQVVCLNMRHDSFIWDMTRSFETWLRSCRLQLPMQVLCLSMRLDSFNHTHSPWKYPKTQRVCHSDVTRLILTWYHSFVCDMTHSYVTWLMRIWHDSGIRDMTQSYVTWLSHTWHDSFLHTYSLHGCARRRSTSDSVTWHDSFLHDMTHSYVTWLFHMWHDSFICHMTHSYVTWLVLAHTVTMEVPRDAACLSHKFYVYFICIVHIYREMIWTTRLSQM